MGLVDYPDSSGSEDEAPPKPTPAKPASTTGKKPFQKVVDRSNPGRIIVNLPSTQTEDPKPSSDEPPAKRARTGKSGLFSGFNSFLPAPKNAAKAAPAKSSNSSSSRPVFQLKTGAEPGFSRDIGGGDGEGLSGTSGGGMSLPAPKAQAQPTIPEGMTPADEVKLVGKPMMFKPLSVARKPKKKTLVSGSAAAPKATPTAERGLEAKDTPAPAPAPVRTNVSLFSIETDDDTAAAPPDAVPASGAYEPLFATEQPTDNGYADYAAQPDWSAPTTAPDAANSLDTIADDLNLSAAARRELFGRKKGGGVGAPQTASRVINFNMDKEYQHNEELRASGQQQIHNPVRSIAPGKHNLRQLVNQVQNQREALEESFAKGKSNRKEASSRYGW
ncbi:hypothetical protein LZ32DRAFT_606497 [Colletotrichum eremochloae]|nr:hypothetical protein LZ32DRAFT_606497 [Colletotrichum eremochloae]